MTILIRGGTVVNHDYSRRADVIVDAGKIAQIGASLAVPAGAEIVDADGMYVMPGGIDPHVHLDMPFMSTSTADDYDSGTAAALSGGTTMVVDFCLPKKGQSLLDAYRVWQEKGRGARCDWGLHMTVTWWHEQVWREMETCVRDYGINTFKHFLAYKDALMINDDDLFHSFRRCASLGAMPLVHAENGDIVWRLQEHYANLGMRGPEAHTYSRPAEVEGEATNRAIMVADIAEVPVYIVHTSSKEAHEAIERARAKGQRVYGEPLIQHLVLDESDYLDKDWDYAAARVMSPPFRHKSHQESLWAGLQSGSLQVVATDHSAFTKEQKRAGIDDFRRIPNGTTGLEDRLPVLWTAGVNTGRLTKEEFVAVTSANIARILNIYPRKGAVIEGADADLVVWDPRATKTISAETQISRAGSNVFEGYACTGLPAVTISRGEIAARYGEVLARPGTGEFVKRTPFAPVQVANMTWKKSKRPKPVDRFEVVP